MITVIFEGKKKDSVVSVYPMQAQNKSRLTVPFVLSLSTNQQLMVYFIHPSCFTPTERARVAHCIGSWVGTRATLDIFQMKKTLASVGNQIPDHSAHSLITIPNMLSWL
jgi:hypothetical protein